MSWKEFSAPMKAFHLEDEPYVIYVIKTQHKDLYIVVLDDAFQHETGKTEICSKEEIETKYKIKL